MINVRGATPFASMFPEGSQMRALQEVVPQSMPMTRGEMPVGGFCMGFFPGKEGEEERSEK